MGNWVCSVCHAFVRPGVSTCLNCVLDQRAAEIAKLKRTPSPNFKTSDTQKGE